MPPLGGYRAGMDKDAMWPGPPWQEIVPGGWIAPVGTPAPAWLDLDEVVNEVLRPDDEKARRFFLNNTVTGSPAVSGTTPGNPLDDIDSARKLL